MLELGEMFKKEVKLLKDYLFLVTVYAKNYGKAVVDIVSMFMNEQRIPGVYVTLNKPYEIIKRNLEGSGIDPQLMIFIDANSKFESAKKIGNCLYIGSPEKLSDISVAMEQAVNALPTSEKFLVFDSLNTLLIFNKESTVARFAHFLTVKIREWKVKGVIITLEKETPQALLDEMVQFSDSRIEMDGAA